ncbi:CLUMA_CG008748, isoform A [Clunio marinus]|uniref:CLUMA_CG008748, isoform A n=1 Tax=Clunio marinus TaxID=568069 RepID=A0A1J1I5D7_9DIPT|nr:CLUMA_CG008748, isoform A [Clunio marinus]
MSGLSLSMMREDFIDLRHSIVHPLNKSHKSILFSQHFSILIQSTEQHQKKNDNDGSQRHLWRKPPKTLQGHS